MRKQNPRDYKYTVKILTQYFGDTKKSNSLIKRLLIGKRIVMLAILAYIALL